MIVYAIKNLLNNKLYVGQTTRTLEQRFKEHQTNISSNIGKAIAEYGVENFSSEILEVCDSIEQLNEREKYWIAQFDCIFPKGYNVSEGGGNFQREHYSKKSSEIVPESLKVSWVEVVIALSTKESFLMNYHKTLKHILKKQNFTIPTYLDVIAKHGTFQEYSEALITFFEMQFKNGQLQAGN